MNKQQKKIVLSYVVFLCVLALFFFLIVGYAISQDHITGYADFFQKAADTEEMCIPLQFGPSFRRYPAPDSDLIRPTIPA